MLEFPFNIRRLHSDVKTNIFLIEELDKTLQED